MKQMFAATLIALMLNGAQALAMGADGRSDPQEPRTNTTQQRQTLDAEKACTGDISRFCSVVRPGGGRLKACLAKNNAAVSTACTKAMNKAGTAFNL